MSTYYLGTPPDDDLLISSEVYDGEEVPGPNTITKERLAAFKRRSYLILNSAMFRSKTDPPLTTDRGELENMQMKLFKELVAGNEDPKLDDEDKRILVDRKYLKPAVKKTTPISQQFSINPGW